MKTDKAVPVTENSSPAMISAVMAAVITMLLSNGFLFMYGTAIDMDFKILPALILTFITSLASVIIHYQNKKKLSAGALIAAPATFALMLLFNMFNVRKGFLAFLYYVKFYAFYKFPGTYAEPDDPDAVLFAFLIAYNLISTCVTAYLLLKRKRIPAALLTYLPLFICAVANIVMKPDQIPSLIAAAGVFLLMLTHVFRNKNAATAERAIVVLAVPVLALTLLTAVIFPEKRYGSDEWAKNILYSIQESIEEASGRDDPVSRILDKALNGFNNPNSESNSDVFSPLYATKTNLSKVGPFDPPQTRILSVLRMRNENYNGKAARYTGNIMYYKIESFDRYENNTLSSTSIRSKIYADGYEPEPQSAQYSLTITPLESSGVDIVPYYTDFYTMDGIGSSSKVNPYNNTHNLEKEFAASSLPVRTGNIYSEWYINFYVYRTALTVPRATENALINSGKLPDWYIEVYKGQREMSDADKVRGVTEFVSNLHPYDVNTEIPPEDVDFVPWFVSDAESGICVHYAVTSVVLLRMIGVPARYVRGYVDTRSYDNAESIIYASQAHAWFEFFVPEYGWIMGDSTPGYGPDAANFNIDAVSRISPEIETASFSKGNYTYEPPETTAASKETSEPSATSSNADQPGPSSTPTPTVPAGQQPANPDRTVIITNSDHSAEQDSKFTEFEMKLIKVLAEILIIAVSVWLLIMIAKLVFTLYWKNRFTTGEINDRVIAYYHYYRFMGRLFRFEVPAIASDIAEKAAFSGRDISTKELNMLLAACREHMTSCANSFSRIKLSLYRLCEIKIRENK